MTEQTFAYLLAGLAALLWGFAVIPIKSARTSGRLGIAIAMATGMTTMFALSAPHLGVLSTLTLREAGLYLITGAMQFTLGCGSYYLAVQKGSLSVAVPITRVKILLVLGLSILLGLEVFRWGLLVAAMLVFLGGLMVGKPLSSATLSERDGHWASIGFAIAACTFWAVSETLMGLLPTRMPPMVSNGLLLASGMAAWCLLALVVGWWRELLAMPRHDVLCFVAHGLISFSAAYALFVWAIKLSTPPRVVTITSTYPLISALVGWVAYREGFSPRLGLGAVLLIGGVILLQFA
ncbi:MAG: DMT family transporter [Armatimonadota bacterium]|jgi:drug/metabolite transporter (DMT)-like permease